MNRRFLWESLILSILFGMTIIALVVLISATVQVKALKAVASIERGEGTR